MLLVVGAVLGIDVIRTEYLVLTRLNRGEILMIDQKIRT